MIVAVAEESRGADHARQWIEQAGAQQRNTAFSELIAPDFTLPDIDGVPHALSALRGKKVFLCTWASW